MEDNFAGWFLLRVSMSLQSRRWWGWSPLKALLGLEDPFPGRHTHTWPADLPT